MPGFSLGKKNPHHLHNPRLQPGAARHSTPLRHAHPISKMRTFMAHTSQHLHRSTKGTALLSLVVVQKRRVTYYVHHAAPLGSLGAGLYVPSPATLNPAHFGLSTAIPGRAL